jgi:hypothetical protein
MDEQDFESLFIGNQEFDELERSLDVFCPFEAIGMVKQEIRHGRFLRYVLDPQRPHGFGDACIRVLMEKAANALRGSPESKLSPLDVHLMRFEDAWVPKEEYKSIDILLVFDVEKLVVAIELKIEASEHSGQLGRYRKIVETDWPTTEGWRHILLFLTARGDQPSEEHGEGWISLPLEDIADGFEHLVRRQVGSAEASSLLDAYVGMLRRHHMSNRRLEEIARKLWSEHREALEFLSDRRPNLRGEIVALIHDRRGEFAKGLSERTGLTFSPDHSTTSIVRFSADDWCAVPGMQTGTGWKPSSSLLVLEIDKGRKESIVARFELGPGDPASRSAIFDALKAHSCDVGGNWPLSGLWRQLACKDLLKVNEDATMEIEQGFEKVLAAAGSFVNAHAEGYSNAMRSLDKSGIA